jgi:hypothetical protein
MSLSSQRSSSQIRRSPFSLGLRLAGYGSERQRPRYGLVGVDGDGDADRGLGSARERHHLGGRGLASDYIARVIAAPPPEVADYTVSFEILQLVIDVRGRA